MYQRTMLHRNLKASLSSFGKNVMDITGAYVDKKLKIPTTIYLSKYTQCL